MSASYPTAPKTFTNRSAGQSVASAHVNDLQDEVNAIETGLLSGTAPLTSSNTTVANLTVSGGSTLATLSVSGGSTFAGAVTFSGNLSTPGSFQSSNSTVLGTLQLRSAAMVPQQVLTLTGGSTTFNDIAVASSAVWLALDGNSTAVSVTGITGSAGVHGRVLWIANTNVSGQALTLVNASAGSSVGGRFVLAAGANKTLANFAMVTALYSTAALGGNQNVWVVQST